MIKSLNKKNIGIFLLAYKRISHLKRNIYNLNKYLNKKDKVFIFADNFSLNQDKETINNIKSLKVYLRSLDKKKFKIIFKNKRYGLKKNWYEAYDYMFRRYNKVICLEDDIIINKNFLNFMYFYLNYYEKNKNIMSITGFGTKLKHNTKFKYDCYLTKRPMAWGQASWKRVWKKFKSFKFNHKNILKDKRKLISGGQDLIVILIMDYLKLANSFQILWTYFVIKNNGLCINPTSSLVKNIGYDGTGFHTKKTKSFPISKIKKNSIRRMKKVIYDNDLNNLFNRSFEIKKLTFIIFYYLPVKIVKLLISLKIYFSQNEKK